MSDITPTFHGEVQLASWSESHNGGAKVVLWLSEPSDLDAFRALTLRKGNTAGQRFMVAMVEIGEDEQPVQSEPAPAAPKGGALSRLAAQLCATQPFHLFLRAHGLRCENERDAAECIRQTCGVSSRAELDHDQQGAHIFHEKIRKPFLAWQEAGGHR
ncbi:hypothetical protein M0D69_13785 [Caballeronia sp. SEWSISQ10-4 2]|uniref:hypothetical protein n=1 Tax=Caballeronia sp. SEWSISQ10-4 2 TaxID=2937438 RepID=UPI00265442FB|nr:hypothetical protein [Caballeronia sp. SEWSISQ10-4 2]MDN7179064.1 hypothetical protein [Caballeronia sp. SEWSISQ10-4 2]